jgi:RNA polymerase sigma factor (TIGR02999 family)
MAVMTEVTRILQKMAEGDTHESAALMPLVYNELRRLAARELRNDPAGNTLQPTALVHEAYVRLVDQNNEPRWNHRGHFYAAAAEAMRRVLVESARRKQSLKRGGGRERVPLEESRMAAPQRDAELLALDDALTRLAAHRPKAASLVSLRYFAGLTMEQAAASLGVSLRTAERNWTYAKAWLLETMAETDGQPSGDGAS